MLRFAVVATALVLTAAEAASQPWPSKPVRIIVPYAAGGGVDIVGRQLSDSLRAQLGQPFIVENRAGAGGMIGADAVAKAQPVGYTLLVSSVSEIAVNQSIYPKMSYDPIKDLAPITLIGWTPLVFAAHPSLKVSNPAELLALLKSKPGQMSYSSPGLGSGHHLAGELLKKVGGVDMTHVVYRGAAPAIQDAVSGQVPLTVTGLPPAVELIKADKLKAVAMTSAKRSALFPSTAALAELGPAYADFDITNWFGFLGPAGIPREIRDKLNVAALKAIGDEGFRKRLAEQGAEPVGNSPDAFAAQLRAEAEKYARIAKVTGVKVQQ